MSNHKETPNQTAHVKYLLTTVHDHQMAETVKSEEPMKRKNKYSRGLQYV
jgi:hypothetical protein